MTEPIILAIDTSCDETSAAVTQGRRVLANVISSQINIHKKYGGVFPALAKRAHLERIDIVIAEALKRGCGWEVRNESRDGDEKCVKNFSNPSSLPNPDSHLTSHSHIPVSAIAVTYGPGLAIALEVGIAKAKQLCLQGLALEARTPLIAVNHMEGHIYSCLAQNKNGRPEREVVFPALCLLVSGGHTELVWIKNHGDYTILGQTLDDAAGEALDKAARILKLGYPGGPIIERLAQSRKISPCGPARRDLVEISLTPPLKEKYNLNFSYSGLKTQFLYFVEKLSPEEFSQNLYTLAAVFQEAVFEQLIRKASHAIEAYQPKTLLCGGGVIANKYLRTLLRRLVREYKIPVFFPPKLSLVGDNAAMIGVAAYYKYQRNEFVEDIESLDRVPRLSL